MGDRYLAAKVTAVGAVLVAFVTVAGQLLAARLNHTHAAMEGGRGESPVGSDPLVRVIAPLDGIGVGPSGAVTATTECRDLHYIAVTPLRTGDRWIVDGPIRVVAGQMNGRARYGEGDIGVGERFSVEILCSPLPLSLGRLDALPAATEVSASTAVIRQW